MEEKINVVSVSYIEEGTDSPILKDVKSEFDNESGSNVLEVGNLNHSIFGLDETSTNSLITRTDDSSIPLSSLTGVFICHRCSFSCSSMNNLISHYQTYREEDPFTCFECGFIGSDEFDFVEHSRSHIEDNYFRCYQCPFTTTNLNEIKEHFTLNHSHEINQSEKSTALKPLKCPLCDRYVASKYNLKKHIVDCPGPDSVLINALGNEEPGVRVKKEIDESSILTCPHCFFIFSSKEKLAQHVEKSHSKGRYRDNRIYDVPTDEVKLNMIPKVTLERIYLCPICHFVFTSSTTLNKHVITHKEVTECPVCKCDCETNVSLREHFMVHASPDKLHVCTVCEMKFLSDGKLKNHMKEAHDSRRYNCEYCCQGVKSESELKLHMEAHSKIKEFYCPKCKFSAKNSSVLQFHMSRFHPSRKRFICKDCGKSYKYKYSLDRHNLNCPVKNVKPPPPDSEDGEYEAPEIEIDISQKEKLNCAECKAPFDAEEDLRKHLLVHFHSAPFRCGNCGLRFKTKNRLSYHMKMHNIKANYRCNICDRTFKYRHALNNHRVSHSDARPFNCDVCGLTFKRKANYRRHYDIHSEIRPFPCPYCRYSGRRKDNLQKHIVHHHPGTEDSKQAVFSA